MSAKSPDGRAQRSGIGPRGGPPGGRTGRSGEGIGARTSSEALPVPPRPRSDGASASAWRRRHPEILRRNGGGPCGANYCMSRNRAPKGSPSQVKRHSLDRDARPDVLPFFFCFVICGVCPLARYTRFSRRGLCGSGLGLSCRGVRTTTLGGTTVARAGVEAVAGVRLRVFAVPCCLCWCRLCDQFRCTCSRGDCGRRGRVALL